MNSALSAFRFNHLLALAAEHGQVAKRGGVMVLWRLLALGVGVVGTVWVARCMGPENLGISSIVAATCIQLGLFVRLNQDAHYVRLYKRDDRAPTRVQLIQGSFTLRLVAATSLACGTGVVLLFFPPPAHWLLAIAAGFPILLFDQNPPGWVLQAQENQPAQYKATAVKGVVITIGALLLFRPGMAPGTDLLLTALAGGIAWCVAWHWAVGGGLRGLSSQWNWSAMFLVLPELRRSISLVLTGFVIYGYSQFQLPLIGYLRPLTDVGVFRSAAGLTDVANSFLVMIPALLYPRYIDWHQQGPSVLWKKQLALCRGALFAIIPAGALIFFLAPVIYPMIYGPAFAHGARCFSLLLLAKLAVVLNGIFGWGLWAQGADRVNLVIMSGTAAISIGLNLLIIPMWGIDGAASVNLTSELLILAGCVFASYRIVSTASTTKPETVSAE